MNSVFGSNSVKKQVDKSDTLKTGKQQPAIKVLKRSK